jgi:hypothetical protein
VVVREFVAVGPELCLVPCKNGGRDSSVGIATGYGLDGLGIESGWGRDFSHPSRPAVGPTQPPVTIGTESSPVVKRPERGAYHSPLLAPRLRMSRAIPLLPVRVLGACYRANVLLLPRRNECLVLSSLVYATSRKVAGSMSVSLEFFMNIIRPNCGPGVDKASSGNEYQEFFLGGRGDRCIGLTSSPSCAGWLEIWDSQLPGTLRAFPGLLLGLFCLLLVHGNPFGSKTRSN